MVSHHLYDTKTNSKLIKHLNLKFKTLTLIEKNVGKTSEDISIGTHFLKKAPVGHSRGKY